MKGSDVVVRVRDEMFGLVCRFERFFVLETLRTTGKREREVWIGSASIVISVLDVGRNRT